MRNLCRCPRWTATSFAGAHYERRCEGDLSLDDRMALWAFRLDAGRLGVSPNGLGEAG